MSKLFIKADAFPGTNIEEAITEAMSLMNILGFTVQLNFNGRKLYIRAGIPFEQIYKTFLAMTEEK